MNQQITKNIASQGFADIGNVCFAAVSVGDRIALDGTNTTLPDPLKIDLFNTSRNKFCGWLDCYFNDSGTDGNMCFTDWRIKDGRSQIKTYDLPYEAIFGIGSVPRNPVDLVSGAIQRAKILHDKYADADNWKDLEFVLSQRIDQEYMEKVITGTHVNC